VPQSGCEPLQILRRRLLTRTRWFPRQRKWKWPAEYRTFMGWIFALAILAGLASVARAILHPRSRTLLQSLLLGPIFYSTMALLSGIALWAIWKDKSWARWWAVAASSIYLLEFLRQFIIPVRPAWDHHVSSLIAGIAGVAAFSWRDKQLDADSSDQPGEENSGRETGLKKKRGDCSPLSLVAKGKGCRAFSRFTG
jgi:hypothetical protein